MDRGEMTERKRERECVCVCVGKRERENLAQPKCPARQSHLNAREFETKRERHT